VTFPDAATESPVFERLIEVVVGIVLAGIMADPLPVCVDMGRFRVSGDVSRRAASRVRDHAEEYNLHLPERHRRHRPFVLYPETKPELRSGPE
jgi:hypothetical protein